jgi:hypothetical protein
MGVKKSKVPGCQWSRFGNVKEQQQSRYIRLFPLSLRERERCEAISDD